MVFRLLHPTLPNPAEPDLSSYSWCSGHCTLLPALSYFTSQWLSMTCRHWWCCCPSSPGLPVCRGGLASQPPSYWSIDDDSTGPASDCPHHQLRQLLYCTTALLHCVIVCLPLQMDRGHCVWSVSEKEKKWYKGREGICTCVWRRGSGWCLCVSVGCVCVCCDAVATVLSLTTPSLLLHIV